MAFQSIYAQFLRGQLDQAKQAASTQKTALLTSDPAWSFKFCLLEAEILQFQGRSQDVVDVLARQDQSFPPQGDLAIKQAILLSLADARLGRQQQSVAELREAQRLSQETHSPLQGEVLRTQGLLENRNGQQSAAAESLQKSLDFARTHKDDYLEASDLLNLGRVALQAEHIDEALDRFNASSQLAEKIHADLLLQSGQGNAGWAYYALGDFDRALQSFRQARAQAQRLGATDSEILWLQSSGLALFRLGDIADAQACYEEALRATHVIGDTARQAESETSLSLLFLQLNQLDAARAHAVQALEAAQQVGDKGSILDASLLQALIAARTSTAPEVERMLFLVMKDAESMPSISWEAENAMASLYAARHLPAQADSWFRRSIQTFETQRDSVQEEESRLPFFANGDELYCNYADFLIASRRSDEALRLLDRAHARILQDGLGGNQGQAERSQPYKLATVVRQQQALVLFYSLGPQRSYLWAVAPSGTHFFFLPPAPEIAARIKSYQASILKSHDPLVDADPDSLWLYDKLVAPAEAFLPADARVLVIPDGPLNGFNLETLLKRGTQGLHYWMEDVSLTTATSLQLLSQAASPDDSQQALGMPVGRLLLIGDPINAGSDYPALAHAAAEVESVERYFPGERRTSLTQAAAVPTAYAASHPGQYAYLHFVAHGMASSLHPLDSAIVLSPSTTDPDRFKLYARDIVQQPLHARLVTISACYGSGVRNYAGEGLVGLSWAFLRAGAHQVIGALWEVNDSSTPQLMDQLYHGLAQGQQPDRALRAAKLSMLHSQGVFRKPLYWAAFQLYTGS